MCLLLVPALTGYAQFEVKGRIALEDGGAPAMACISLQRDSISIQDVSDGDGNFLFRNLKPGSYQLAVSFIGYETYTETISVSTNSLELRIVLKSSSIQLSEVTVSAISESRELSSRPITIASLDVKTQFEKKLTLGDMITTVPGVRVRVSGGLGSNADVSINGMRGNSVRIYVDGIPLEFIASGLNISQLPMNAVERIDIYKGVMPVEIGTDALGGGINIATKNPAQNTLSASYRFGSFNTHQAGIMLGLINKKKELYFSVNSSYDYSDNNYTMRVTDIISGKKVEAERFNDDFKSFYSRVTVGLLNKKFADELQLAASFVSFEKGYQQGITVNTIPFGEARYEADNISLQLSYRKEIGKKLKIESKFNYSRFNYVFIDTTKNIYSWTGEVFMRHQFGGESTNHQKELFPHITTSSLVNRTTLQYEIEKAGTIAFSNFIAHQEQTGHDPVVDETAGDIDYLKRPQEMTKNIAGLQYSLPLFDKRVTLGAAVKLYYYKVDGLEPLSKIPLSVSDTREGWNTFVKYAFFKNWFVRGSFERALRIPDFMEVFGDNTLIVPNIQLKPEESDNLNLGIVYDQKFDDGRFVYAELNGFTRDFTNRIFLNSTFSEGARYENRQAVDVKGAEVALRGSPVKNLTASWNITYQSIEIVDWGLPNHDYLTGTPLPNEPVFFYNAEVRYDFKRFKKVTPGVYVFFNHINEFRHIPTGKQYNPDNYVPAQSQLDVGASAKFLQDKFIVSVNAHNILDAEMYDYYKVPRPGRNFNVQLIYQLNKF